MDAHHCNVFASQLYMEALSIIVTIPDAFKNCLNNDLNPMMQTRLHPSSLSCIRYSYVPISCQHCDLHVLSLSLAPSRLSKRFYLPHACTATICLFDGPKPYCTLCQLLQPRFGQQLIEVLAATGKIPLQPPSIILLSQAGTNPKLSQHT
jgi:hypothetical protein